MWDYKTSTYTPTITPIQTATLTSTPIPIKTDPSYSGSTITNSINMEFVLIPAGEFDMGSNNYRGEDPVHHVKISNAFYMGKYEVTQKQWRDVMGNIMPGTEGDNIPVKWVSWNDVQDFIKKLNEKEDGDKYRLPSEAEWEYAARAGTTTRYSFGDEESKLGEYAWYFENSKEAGDFPVFDVGQKKPNPWGLYDMYGNIAEMVQDTYHESYNGAPTDGSAWEGSGSDHVFRGGSWASAAWKCRSASRDRFPDYRDNSIGFRLLRIS
jgi:formylglycine-generating enzyme required for sulfatase activity